MNIPLPILIACFALVILFAGLLFRMLQEASQTHGAMRKLAEAFRFSTPRGGSRNGLENGRLMQLRERCEKLPDPMLGWWYEIEHNLLNYVTPEGREGWYLGAPPRQILPEERVSERYYHSSFYQVVPGILTGLGLAATFVSILLALTGLHVTVSNGMETVTGIKELIGGLSGKFVSSIVGLLLSITFIFFERKWCERRLVEAYEALLEDLSDLIPTISPARVQVDIQALVARQTQSIEAMSTQVTGIRSPGAVYDSGFGESAEVLADDVDLFSEKLETLRFVLDRGIKRLRQ